MNMNNVSLIRKNSALLLLLIFAINAFAQDKSGYNWYFGNRAGMTWNTTQSITSTPIFGGGGAQTLNGIPTPLTGSALANQLEGVFGMSDANGNLMFYSDGVTIWNRNHVAMTNGSGLTGHWSSTQSGIVIPFPGDGNKFIAFCIGASEQGGGATLTYSVIDMTASGGLGAVIEKNMPVTGHRGRLLETVSAVRHANGVDYWVVAPGAGNASTAALNVWRVTSTGVQPACHHVHYTGIASSSDTHAGYFRFSADGEYFVWPEHVSTRLFFGRLNTSTGTFSLVKYVRSPSRAYGCEISPDNEVVYVSTYMGNTVLAYKLSNLLAAPDNAAASAVAYKTVSVGTTTGALQLAPDGRIYGSLGSGSSGFNSNILVIDNVSDYDNFKVHRINGLLPSGTGGGIGLPNIMSHYLAPGPGEISTGAIGSRDTICIGDTPAALVSIEDGVGVASYLWQQSTDSILWVSAPGTNDLPGYSPPALTTTTHYRRRVITIGDSTMYSNVVTIIALNCTPIVIAVPDTVSTLQNTPILIDVLANDNITSCPTVIPTPAAIFGTQGSAVTSGDKILYTPATNFIGSDSLEYSIVCSGTTYTAKIYVYVAGITVNDVTICSGDPVSLSASLTVPGSITSPIFRWYEAATGGAPIHTGPTYIPSPNLTTTTTFYVSVSGDNYNEGPRKAVTVTVTPRATPAMIKITQ